MKTPIDIGRVGILVLVALVTGVCLFGFVPAAERLYFTEDEGLQVHMDVQDIDPRPPKEVYEVEGTCHDPELLAKLTEHLEMLEHMVDAQAEMACACYGRKAPEDCR